MNLLIDIIVIAFIIICVFWGYKKGLVKLGIKLLSFFIAIVITLVLYRPIAGLIIQYTTIDESIQNMISSNMESKSQEKKKEEIEIIEKSKDKVLSEVSITLAHNIIYIGVMIILFIISKIALFFVSALADIVTKLPVIEQFNKAGGILYGVLVGFFIIYIILLIISFIEKANTTNNIYKEIENTYVTKLMYENNILNIFLK